MARLTHTVIEPGDDRDAADVNTLFTDLQTQSTSLDAPNFASQGLDSNVLLSGASSYRQSGFEINTGDSNTAFSSASFAQLVINGVSMRVNFSTPLVIASGEALRLRASFEASGAAGAIGIPASHTLDAVLVYLPNGGGATTVVESERTKAVNTLAGVNDYFKLFYRLPAGTYDWIEVRCKVTGGGTCRVNNGTMTARVYRASV